MIMPIILWDPSYSFQKLAEMERTKCLDQEDKCLRDYVDRNLSKFKHDVPSVFMDKAQLSRFYADMLTCQNNENFK